ncbi:MAG: sugar ABC transporter substrate-binding protein [Jatrophihabitans sp.]|uniref:sugar ABC transporter substrate-binding protein n=1 Tax=Jatrophihabitans sp. TaxID=1932789 RepID=UPI003F7FEBBC
MVAIISTGCSSNSAPSGDAGSSTSSRTSATSTDAESTRVAAAVAALYRGTSTTPPTSGPKAVTGKKVWILSCGQIATGCSIVTAAAAAAAQQLGWSATVYDGKFNQSGAYSAGVREAIAAKADAIVDVSIDCAAIAAPLAQAKAAGIKVIATGAYDCNDPRTGGHAQFDGEPYPNDARKTIAAYAAAWGRAKADWVIDKTNGKAVALSIHQTDAFFGADIASAFDREMATCAACKVIKVDTSGTELLTGALPPKISQALLQHPDINAIHTIFDSVPPLGVAQAVVRSGHKSSIAVIGGEGFPANLQLIRSDAGQNAAVATDPEWQGWAAADELNRIFAGQATVAEGYGFLLVDASHNLPASGALASRVDFKAAYEKVWGR